MAYLALADGVVFDLGKANDRSLARVRVVLIARHSHHRLIFDN